ncbi:MAG: acetate--CoA ligase [Thermoplasmata archaeon]
MAEEKAQEKEKTIESMLVEGRKFPPSEDFRNKANIKSMEEYKELYERSLHEPEKFWAEQAEELHWFRKWKKVLSWDPPFVKWFEGGKINVSYNCLDRHLKTWKKNKAAIIWEGEPGDTRTFTYHQLHREVCRFANVLAKFDITKGDRVCLYMPMVPELAIAMLACARIGAVHNIVFGGFSSDALRDRILDSGAKLVVTSDGSFRRGKRIPLKSNTDRAVETCPSVENVIVVNRTNIEVRMKGRRDHWWHDVVEGVSTVSPIEKMDSEDPLFILYTSGTTGKPKGVLHTSAGYLLYVYLTSKWVFDLKEEDTYWCTADIGWVTGHSYIVYGPLANGAASIMFEGVPNYPKPDRFWEVVEKYGVNIFYTAPTAIRAMMKDGEEWPNRHDLSSLRLLGSVGEPINPEAWMWYHKVIGKERCPIVDTWWQTETGGILISPLPGAMALKPGSACKPLPGIVPAILREDGSEAEVNEGGYLVIKEPWPGMLRTLYKDPEKFKNQYFSKYPNYYFTGDGARIDEESDYWLMGRIDDVINVSGHRIGTMEVESALVSHDIVAEAAVVPMPHEIKGQGLYAFVTLKEGVERNEALHNILRQHVAKEIGPIAKPDKIQFADALPKTRSGKIMRRILKVIASGGDDCGDTTTLADPTVVKRLLEERV